MNTRVWVRALLLVILMGIAVPSRPQEQSAPENNLNQLAWMVGGKWKADGEKGPDGKPFHVEWSCKWGDNQRNLKFTTWFLIDGKLVPVYDGIYAWHAAKKKFVFLYTDNEGNLTEGEAVVNGDRLEHDFHIVGADGVARPFRSTIIRHGADDYDWNVQHEKDGAWTEMFALKYKRSRS